MTNREAINLLEEIKVNKAYTEALEMALKVLEKTQWIPVKKRLPEKNEVDENGFAKAYLVQYKRLRMAVARWDGKFWVLWGHCTAIDDVVAWMPSPEPYQEV